ncbi:MAG: hypothetical protein CMD39_04320 [Gammaproteobacteria bacterium]|nr:hypothetical protein [Gammaproteobacteria bacterium]
MLEPALTTPILPARRAASRLLSAFTLALVVGCGGASVSVPPVLPVPLVEKIPLTMGYHLSDELLGYVHEESLEDSGDWTIAFGSAQTTMFDNLLNGMFEAAVPVAGPEAAGPDVDGVLVPNIEEVQFSTPEQTRSDYFEVWVRYRMRLHGRDGALVGEWPLTAYGKANARNYGMNSREPALQAAALAAMRDAMAFFTVQFRTVPPVQTWLQAELAAPAAAPTGGASP